jgi:1-phosphatidylinositol-4-phosphate 5-kinase
MSNVLLTRGELISERYDIKGSWVNRNADVPRDGQLVSCRYCNKAYTFRRQQLHGRKASQGSSQSASLGWLSESGSLSASSADNKCPYTVFGMHKPNVTLKDNDLKSRMLLSPVESRTLLDQLRKDAEFLYQHDFMDYSLLIGVHNTEYQVELPRGAYPQPGDQKLPRSSTVTPARDSCRPSVFTGSVAPGSDGGDGEDDPLLSLVSPRYQATRVVGAESYYFGIIDFQQKWDYSKTAERWAKMLFEPDRNGISAVEPGFYRDRFIRTLEELFVHHEEDSESQA